MDDPLGHVHVLPWDTPGLPPRSHKPDDMMGDWYFTACNAKIAESELPPHQFGKLYKIMLCTREKHSPDEIHTCRLYNMKDPNEPLCIIVWGGE